MKICIKKTRLQGVLAFTAAILVAVFAFLLVFPLKTQNEGGMYALNTISAQADSPPSIAIESYDVQMNLRTDRKVEVKEKITVKFLQSGLTMFYRMLPKTDARYYDIQVSCDGNSAFSYYVADNPDYSEFMDINCVGGAQKGNIWTYDISYLMEEDTGKDQEFFRVNVIGFGWPVALKNVSAEITFPDIANDIDYAVGGYNVQMGEVDASCTKGVEIAVSEDKKSVRLTAQELGLKRNYIYDETMAAGFTVECKFAEGVLADYHKTRMSTKNMPWIFLVGTLMMAVAVVICWVTRKKHEIITTVNVSAPDEMDPLKMGVWLDGTADNEDVTSMIYYFADKGYLGIDLTDEDDPVLIKKADLPSDSPVYMKTLFNGLFKSGDSVAVSSLTEKYYASVEIAKKQLPTPTMYEPKSILGFVLGGILGGLYMAFVPFLMGKISVNASYSYWNGFIGFLPILFILFILFVRENYRFKWKKSVYTAVGIGMIAVAVIATLIFSSIFARHIMTEYEIAVMCIAAFGATFAGSFALSRKESYVKELGDILGFKDFIVYTEEDKIKVMLEQNPQLYYKVLPYAQVLGVTNEWEGKFANLLIEPPTWCYGYHMSMFDYMVLNRCMTRAMVTAMRPPQTSTGGRSGGGSFGSFGGGGFGGGGGGAR